MTLDRELAEVNPTMSTVDDFPCRTIGFLTSEATLVKNVSCVTDMFAAVRNVGGRSSPRSIMLESAASIRYVRSATPRSPDLLDVIATLPEGHRTKARIDHVPVEERSSWSGRG
jgi:hypothetical protein